MVCGICCGEKLSRSGAGGWATLVIKLLLAAKLPLEGSLYLQANLLYNLLISTMKLLIGL